MKILWHDFEAVTFFWLCREGILDWVMDSTKRDNKEVQEKLMALQKEKDQVRTETLTDNSLLYWVYQLRDMAWLPAGRVFPRIFSAFFRTVLVQI